MLVLSLLSLNNPICLNIHLYQIVLMNLGMFGKVFDYELCTKIVNEIWNFVPGCI
jgi:hypothetical protein